MKHRRKMSTMYSTNHSISSKMAVEAKALLLSSTHGGGGGGDSLSLENHTTNNHHLPDTQNNPFARSTLLNNTPIRSHQSFFIRSRILSTSNQSTSSRGVRSSLQYTINNFNRGNHMDIIIYIYMNSYILYQNYFVIQLYLIIDIYIYILIYMIHTIKRI